MSVHCGICDLPLGFKPRNFLQLTTAPPPAVRHALHTRPDDLKHTLSLFAIGHSICCSDSQYRVVHAGRFPQLSVTLLLPTATNLDLLLCTGGDRGALFSLHHEVEWKHLETCACRCFIFSYLLNNIKNSIWMALRIIFPDISMLLIIPSKCWVIQVTAPFLALIKSSTQPPCVTQCKDSKLSNSLLEIILPWNFTLSQSLRLEFDAMT